MQVVGCVLFGWSADKIGGGKAMILGSIAVFVCALVYYNALGVWSADAIFITYALLGLAAGSVGVVPMLMVRMYAAPVRFTGISFSYNVSYAIVGGLTLPVVRWLSRYSDIGAMYYVLFLAVLSVFCCGIYMRKFER